MTIFICICLLLRFLIVDFKNSININGFIYGLNGVSLETNTIVYIKGSSDDDDDAESVGSDSDISSTESKDENPLEPENENHESPAATAADSPASEAPLLPAADDLDLVEDAEAGDESAIQDLREKYPFHFEGATVQEAVGNIGHYIREEIAAQSSSDDSDENGDSNPDSNEAGPSNQAGPSGSNPENNTIESKPSKHGRSESTAALESENKRKKNEDDDDNNSKGDGTGGPSIGPSEGENGGDKGKGPSTEGNSNARSSYYEDMSPIDFVLDKQNCEMPSILPDFGEE